MEIPVGYKWEDKQILVVEDDESSSYLLGVILKETGANVAYTTDGEEAVDYIRHHPDVDLILMDVQLPQMDGFTATRKIKSMASDVVIFAQTAFAFSIDQAQASHANDCGAVNDHAPVPGSNVAGTAEGTGVRTNVPPSISRR